MFLTKQAELTLSKLGCIFWGLLAQGERNIQMWKKGRKRIRPSHNCRGGFEISVSWSFLGKEEGDLAKSLTERLTMCNCFTQGTLFHPPQAHDP